MIENERFTRHNIGHNQSPGMDFQTMLLDERRHKILQTVENIGFASLQLLVEQTGVSESTIRRDLEHLDRAGHIRRTRGGAAYVGDSLTDLAERGTRALSEKQAVAKTVAAMIEPGEAILLDGGTTTYEVARCLIGKSLQVVTNSLPILNLLANETEIELIAIGGYLYPKTGVAVGPVAMASLSQSHVRRLSISVGGVTEIGLVNSNTLLVETERRMMEVAEEVVVVTDSGKLGHRALAHLASLEQVDRVVVDAGITDQWRTIFADAGVEVTIAEP